LGNRLRIPTAPVERAATLEDKAKDRNPWSTHEMDTTLSEETKL